MTHRDELPAGLELARTTPTFDESTVPPALLAAHQVAQGVWGRLVVHTGALTFRFDDEPDIPINIGAGQNVVIPPTRPHHLELHRSVTFAVEFHRPAGKLT
jgi:hemoglobin